MKYVALILLCFAGLCFSIDAKRAREVDLVSQTALLTAVATLVELRIDVEAMDPEVAAPLLSAINRRIDALNRAMANKP